MEMGSTLLDSRPPMPHKPFPTTSSFRVTNGFEVSANSSSQHAYAPPHHAHALPHHAPLPDRAHPHPSRLRFPTSPGDEEGHSHCHTEPPIMHPLRGDGSSVVGCISPQPATGSAAAARAAQAYSSTSSDGSTKGQLEHVCGAPLPAHGRCHSSGSALHTSMPPLKVARDAPRPASQIAAAAKAAAASAAAAEVTPPPAPTTHHHHHHHHHHHSAASKPRGRLAGRLQEAEGAAAAAATPVPETAIGHHKAKPAASTTSPVSADQLGWKGLLEFSRSSGAAGVLGPGAGSVEGESQKRSAAQIEICCTAHTNTRVRHLVKSVIRGLKACQEPERPREGMGGTYFFMNENGRKVGILKPCDEEPLAPNNPKGYVGRQLGDPGWKPTVRVGEAAMREVAAYLLDHDGWAKVPTSVLVRARHPIFCYNNRMSSVRASSLDLAKDGDEGKDKDNASAPSANNTSDSSNGGQLPLPMKLGSLQEFVWHECDTSEMGTSRFSASDVHRIGILDIRLFNTDRHAGNMLVRMPKEQSSANLKSRIADSQYELIPIDHGFCLPETLEAPYFEWLHWPQAMLPFSEEELAYIRRIDIEADKELLRKELPNLRPECLRVLEISTMLLKSCAEAGLTLFEIASIMTRPFEGGGEELSDLERFASYARSTVEALNNTESSSESESSGSDGGSSADENGNEQERGRQEGGSDVEEGLPLSAILDNVEEHGPYYGGSSEDAADEDVFGFEEASDTLGRNNSGANADPFLRYYQMSRSPTSSSSLSSADRLSSLGTSNARSSSIPYPINEDATPPPRPTFSSSKRRSGTFGSRNGRHIMGGGGFGQSEAKPIPPSPTPSPFANGPPAMPSSVHITDGFLWRRLKRRQATHAKRRRAGVPYKHAGPKHLLSAQAYPPPIMAFAPDSLCGLFSNMDDNQWARFTCLVQEQVDAGLRSQQWKQERSKENVAPPMSCPRF